MTRLFCIDTAGGWRLVFVCFSLLLCSMSSAIVLHNDNQPTGHPTNAMVGRWSTNASCVAIAPNLILSVKHQGGGIGTNIVLGSTTYKASQIVNLTVDLRIARITKEDGTPANLTEYAPLYIGTSESGQEIVLGGFGRGRDITLETNGRAYGYTWKNESNTILRWATNKINGSTILNTSYGVTNLLYADFDDLSVNMTNSQINNNDPTDYEGIQAEYDSGGGWFLQSTGELVAMIAYLENDRKESWFRNNINPLILVPDIFYGIRISSYDDQITPIINWMPTAVVISGYVYDYQNLPLGGVTITGSNSAGYTTTNLNGYYEIYVPDGWTGNLSASKTGYVFSSLPSFTDIQTNRTDQNFTVVVNQNVSDNFNDNVKSSNWLDISQDYANINVVEANEVLQFTSTNDACDVKACYQSNEWSISTAANFSLKIDFHHLVEDANDYFAYFKLICDANNYACIGIGSEAGVQYYEMQVIENSDVNAVRHTVPVPPATILDGKLYVYYSQSSDYLYLSLSDYGTTTNGILSKGVLVNGWASQPAKIEIGLTSNNCQILPGEVFFDNFVVNTGTLSNWPPKTDINQDGFIDIEDLCEMAGQWLNTGGGFSADIDSDGYVDFVDLARLAEVW